MIRPTRPCECLDDPITRRAVAEMNALVAAAFQKLSCSRLRKLHEELLLEIILHLDITSASDTPVDCFFVSAILNSSVTPTSPNGPLDVTFTGAQPW